jgi:diguanylate cyclase (GGDEF)-like protein
MKPSVCALCRAGAKHLGRYSQQALVAGAIALLLLVGVQTALSVTEARQAAIQRAGVALQNLSLGLADQIERVIASVEVVEDRLLERLARGDPAATDGTSPLLGSEHLHDVMRDIIADMNQPYALVLIDEHGNYAASSATWPSRAISYSDRAYFQFARSHPEIPSFVSDTIVSRRTGRHIFTVVRRLSKSDGTFNGVLVGDIEVSYVRGLFAVNKLSAGGSIELLKPDGILLARYPSDGDEVVPEGSAPPRFVVQPGVSRGPCNLKATRCLIAVSDLSRHHLKIAVAEPLNMVLQSWQLESAWLAKVAALGCLATAIMVALTLRRAHDKRRLDVASAALQIDAERKRADQEIARQHRTYAMALNNMTQGLLMFDHGQRLLLANSGVHAILGLAPGTLKPGMTPLDVARVAPDAGCIPHGSVELVASFFEEMVQKNIPAQFVRHLNDRDLVGAFAPHESGWILTYDDITEIHRANERIVHMAHHDTLTGLPNRAALVEHTETALVTLQGTGSFAVLCLDLDHFKDVNDTLGHPAGDELLCQTAERIRAVIRPSDLVARLGGDEFAVILNHIGDKRVIADIAGRLIGAIDAAYEIDSQLVFVGVSIGIALAPDNGTDVKALMKHADLALYRAKNEGRGRFAFFEPTLELEARERRQTEVELHAALTQSEFQLYYQPLVRVSNRRIVGFEALLRWNHPQRGIVSPSTFIPVAEENGLIVRIGEWALRDACSEAVRWADGLKVAVNLSPVQFRTGNIVETVIAALDRSGLEPNRLELEITESVMMSDADATIATLARLKALGVKIAMDDFGTGYSSLAYLQRFPFDKVKIDRTFICDLDDATNLAIIRAVTSVAETLGIGTTAEGVETEDQFASIRDARCEEAQGFLFSVPLPAAEVQSLLDRARSRIPRIVVDNAVA